MKKEREIIREFINKAAGSITIAQAVLLSYEKVNTVSLADFLEILPLKGKWRIVNSNEKTLTIGFFDGSKFNLNKENESILLIS